MALEQYLELYNTSENRLINEAYKDVVFAIRGLEQIEEIVDVENFKYELTVKVNGYAKAVLKCPPIDKIGVFNIEQVIQDFCITDKSGYAKRNTTESSFDAIGFNAKPHAVHQIDAYCRNRDNLNRISFEIGCSFYNADNGNFAPSKPTPINSTKYIYNRYYFWNAVRQHQYGDVTNFEQYILDGGTKKFLTNFTFVNHRIRTNDYHTLAFFNGNFCLTSGGSTHGGHQNNAVCYNSRVNRVYANLFDADGNSIVQGYVDNNNVNGGTTINPPLYSNNYNQLHPYIEDEGLLYVGVGPANILDKKWVTNAGAPFTLAQFQQASYYKVWAAGSPTPNDKHSEIYHFDMQQDDCKGYETIRLAYLNRVGAWDYYNFTKKSTQITEITRSNFKQFYGYNPYEVGGKAAGIGNYWDYGTYDGGTKTYNVNAINTVEANSNWIREDEALLLEELFTSPDTYMQTENGDYIPVVVTEKDYTKQTKVNDKLIQYVISVQYGHETRIQRL